MNYMNFMLKGSSSLEEYTRSHYPADSHILKYAKPKEFNGRITNIVNDNESETVHIENAYKVTVVSGRIRSECVEVWTKLESQTKITAVVTFIGSLAGIVSAIALGLLMPPLFFVALAVGVVSIGVFVFCIRARDRCNEATKQLSMWDDPLQDYIELCQNDYLKQEKIQKTLAPQTAFLNNYAKEKLQEFVAKNLSLYADNIEKSFRENLIHNIKEFIKLQLSLGITNPREVNSILDDFCASYSGEEYTFLSDLKV